jgi:hypothetical protein
MTSVDTIKVLIETYGHERMMDGVFYGVVGLGVLVLLEISILSWFERRRKEGSDS